MLSKSINERNKINNVYLHVQCTLDSVYSASASRADQTTELNITLLRIPNGWRQTSWLFTSVYWGIELQATEKQIQVVVRVGLKSRTTGLRAWHADHSATLPPYKQRITAKSEIHLMMHEMLLFIFKLCPPMVKTKELPRKHFEWMMPNVWMAEKQFSIL